MSKSSQTSPSTTDSNRPATRNNPRRAARRKRLEQQRNALNLNAVPPKEALAKIAAPLPKTAAPKAEPAAPKIAPSQPETQAQIAKTAALAPKTAVPTPKTMPPSPVSQPKAVKPRRWLAWTALGVLGCALAVVGGVAGTYLSWRGGEQIVPNTFIAGQFVGGLTRSVARERLQERYADLRLTVKTPDDDYDLSLRELGGNLDVNRAVNNAYWFGRTGSIWQNAPRVLTARFDERDIALPVRWDKSALKTRMRAVAKEFNRPAHNASLKVDGNGVRVVPDEKGRALNVGETLARLQRRYHVGLSNIEATVREMAPRIAAADLEGSDVKLEQYTTSFNRGLVGRTKNIHVAAAAVNGRVLLPGQTFSFNASTGERTWEKGYRMAHIFERKPGAAESEVVDGLAGGTCQVSSTLFNAVRKSNQKVDYGLKIVQRESHSLPVTYVPRGLDATVAWPYKDFKFRNTLPNPVYLRTAVEGSRLTVSVWARVPSGKPLLAKNTAE